MTTTEVSISVADAVARHRKAESALRGMRRNGGRTAATAHAIHRHHAVVDLTESVLIAAGRRDLVGMLTEEARLAWRLQGLAAGERPELRWRLRAVRAEIREALR